MLSNNYYFQYIINHHVPTFIVIKYENKRTLAVTNVHLCLFQRDNARNIYNMYVNISKNINLFHKVVTRNISSYSYNISNQTGVRINVIVT